MEESNSVRLEKPIHAAHHLRSFPNVAFETVPVSDDERPFSSCQGRSSFCATLLQAVSGVVALALCPQVMSQAPQHFRSVPAIFLTFPNMLVISHGIIARDSF